MMALRSSRLVSRTFQWKCKAPPQSEIMTRRSSKFVSRSFDGIVLLHKCDDDPEVIGFSMELYCSASVMMTLRSSDFRWNRSAPTSSDDDP